MSTILSNMRKSPPPPSRCAAPRATILWLRLALYWLLSSSSSPCSLPGSRRKTPLPSIYLAPDAPSHAHWFGTDELGRDILLAHYLWRAHLHAGRKLRSNFLTGLGLIIGSVAGYYGGAIDRFVNVVLMNAFLSFPGILLAIAFVAFRGPGIFNSFLRSRSADGSVTRAWSAGRSSPRANANLWKRRALWARAISGLLCTTFCRTLFSR